ncbi:MAG: hypothetical protein ACI8RZ_007944 [Myxococcota bacterium]|jgi:hypothetical protein
MLHTLWYVLTGPDLDGFEQHLIDAIAVNTERCETYGAQTDGATDDLFAYLISSERLIRPTARAIDAMAVELVAAGVDVVVGDFAPMSDNRPVGAPIKPVSAMSAHTIAAADAIIEDMLAETSTLDGFAVVDASATALHALEVLEETDGVYFAMTRHLIESVGYAALHGLHHRCETPDAERVVDALVRSQRLGLVMFDVTEIDAQANVFQRQGIGVLVNDLPVIPFLAEVAVFETEDRVRLEACLR